MASFRDYEATQTATVELFHGESLQVRSVSSPEFMIAALPLHRERASKESTTDEEESRYRVAIAFALVESWTFDDALTLENFIEMLESPSYAPIAGEICKRIDRAGCDMDSFVKKKSTGLSTGSSEAGSLTDQQVTEKKPVAKVSKKSTNKQAASRQA